MDMWQKWKKVKKSGTFYRHLNENKKFSKVLAPEDIIQTFGESSGNNPNVGTGKNTKEETSTKDLDCVQIENYEDDSEAENMDYEEIEKTVDLNSLLRSWAISHNISHAALKDLMEILGKEFPNITMCKDPRTLLKTSKSINIKHLDSGGSYWHQGLQFCLETVFANIKEPKNINININIDGLPIFKSSKQEFWPILFNISEYQQIKPMVIGIYCGDSKPPSVVQYLKPFVDEMKTIIANGVTVNGQQINVKIRAIICDSPARAFIKGVANFNSQHGCLKCTTIGEYSYKSHCNVFPKTICEKRTDSLFRSKSYEKHYKCESPLLDLKIDMVEDIPVGDELHLLYLGLMKKLLVGFKDGTLGFDTKWSSKDVKTINCILSEIKLPSEIHRSVRSLDCLRHWKGTEHRTFLLYVGIVALKDMLPYSAYEHFLVIFCAVTICSTAVHFNLLPLAEILFEHFIEKFQEIYGVQYITSNIHNLIHVVEEVYRFGVLSSFSTFPFENVLGYIKRLLRTGNNPLAQAAKRIDELTKVSLINSNNQTEIYPVLTKFCEIDKNISAQFNQKFPKEKIVLCSTKIEINSGLLFSSKFQDKWNLTVAKEIFGMEKTIKTNTGNVYLYGTRLSSTNNFFQTPIHSGNLNIFCSSTDNGTNCFISLKDIYCKLVALPYKAETVFIPLIHSYKL